MRSRLLQLFIVPVIAGALLLAGTNTAQAASVKSGDSRAAIEARAIQTAETVERSLRATGLAVFTDANGSVHRMSLSGTGLTIDGKAAAPTGPAIAAGFWCNLKVAATVAVILTLSITFIGWMIAGVAAGTAVSIAGISLTASQWSTVMALMTSGGALTSFLRTILC